MVYYTCSVFKFTPVLEHDVFYSETLNRLSRQRQEPQILFCFVAWARYRSTDLYKKSSRESTDIMYNPWDRLLNLRITHFLFTAAETFLYLTPIEFAGQEFSLFKYIYIFSVFAQ